MIVVVTALSTRSRSSSCSRSCRRRGGRCPGGSSLLYGLPLFLAIYLLDLYEREPMSLVLGALAVGRRRGHGARGHRERGLGPRRRTPRRTGVRGRVDGGPDRAVRRRDREGRRRDPDLPDRPRRDGRHDGRLRLRRDGRAPGSRWSRTSSTSSRSSAGRPAACSPASTCAWSRAASTGTCCTRGWRGWGRVLRRPGAARWRSGGGSRSRCGLFGAAVAAHFLWNSPFLNFFPSSVNTFGRLGPDPVRGGRQGRAAAAVRGRDGPPGPPARAHVARDRPALGDRHALALRGRAPGAARPERSGADRGARCRPAPARPPNAC